MSLIGSQLSRFFLALVSVALGVAFFGLSADVLAVTSHPFAIAEQRLSTSSTGWFAEFFAQMAMWQSHFYRQLTGAVRAWQQDGWAAWLLLGLSFAYGVFHALGPGHGKAVLAAYVLANRETVKNGAILALLSAFLQALVAISLVGIAAGVLNVSGLALTRATWWLEIASYAMMVVLGAWLVFRQMIRPVWRWLTQRFARASAASVLSDTSHSGHSEPQTNHHHHAHHHDHHHDHHHGGRHTQHDHQPLRARQPYRELSSSAAPKLATQLQPHDTHQHDEHCGHLHAPDPAMLAGRLTWSKASSAILAVGLRPCTGAIFVLVFSLAQGFFIAGVAAALAMGLGTGLTVAALTTASLWLNQATVSVVGGQQRLVGRWLLLVVQGLASVALLTLGILLFGAALNA
ncbi:MAG: nickel/cobalt transporter [Zwartia sp.]|jgi:ABC-type nickel/cobalt efflux system permease component RcnA